MIKKLVLMYVLAYTGHAVYAQAVWLGQHANTVVVLTIEESGDALRELASLLVERGYVLDMSLLTDEQFSTVSRELIVDEDLEYLVSVSHTVAIVDTFPLTALHLESNWEYASRNERKPMDDDPAVNRLYKERYQRIYSDRVTGYVENIVSGYEDVLFSYPLVK